MLGAIAFILTSVIVLVFALSLRKILSGPKVSLITLSYVLLSIMFLGYGIGAISKDVSIIKFMVFLGNLLIVWASAQLILTRFKLGFFTTILASFFAGLFALLVRKIYFYPEPVLNDGILVFNTQLAVGIFLGVLFLGAWLPVKLAMAKEIADKLKIAEARVIYSGMFTAMVCSALLFLAAKSIIGIIVSFTIISATFLSLTVLNLVASNILRSQKHGR